MTQLGRLQPGHTDSRQIVCINVQQWTDFECAMSIKRLNSVNIVSPAHELLYLNLHAGSTCGSEKESLGRTT